MMAVFCHRIEIVARRFFPRDQLMLLPYLLPFHVGQMIVIVGCYNPD